MCLWAIPYLMRPGQSPADIKDRTGWVWLGSPGWWGSYNKPTQQFIENWLCVVGDLVPTHPNEWVVIGPWP